jgi:hypothetical protein
MNKQAAIGLLAGAMITGNHMALADHLPGHNDSDPSFPIPIPGQSDFNGRGSIIFVTLIWPPGGTTIFDTNLDITYVSDGATPASDLVIVSLR